jgi:hypothetical protein
MMRALEGALALWREAERSLRLGTSMAEPGARAVLERKLAIIEAATRKIETQRRESTAQVDVLRFMSEVHAEAGVPIARSHDAGAAGAVGAVTRRAGAPSYEGGLAEP